MKKKSLSINHFSADKDSRKFFEEVYRDYFDRLYAYALVITKTEMLAKDVISDLFFSLWKNQTDLTAIDNLESYLYVSVKNRAIKLLKMAQDRNQNSLEVRLKTVEMIDPEEVLIESELKGALDKIVTGLPDQCQLVFRMAREQGMKYAEIALELGISIETVKSQLAKAQSRLREGITKYYHEENNPKIPDMRLIGGLLFFVDIIFYEIFI